MGETVVITTHCFVVGPNLAQDREIYEKLEFQSRRETSRLVDARIRPERTSRLRHFLSRRPDGEFACSTDRQITLAILRHHLRLTNASFSPSEIKKIAERTTDQFTKVYVSRFNVNHGPAKGNRDISFSPGILCAVQRKQCARFYKRVHTELRAHGGTKRHGNGIKVRGRER